MKKLRWAIAQFFEKFWWNNYLKKKNPTEYLEWKKKYWISFIEEIQFNFLEKKALNLDIGCGPAGTFIISEQTDTDWLALDPLLENYENLAIFDKTNYPKVQFVNSSFEAFDSKQVFDNIFCINAINHFITLKENFEKLNTLLKPDGTLILSTDAHNYRFLKWILYTLPLDILHPHQYTDTEYERMMTDSGFEILSKRLHKKEFIFSYYIYSLKKKH